MAVGVYDHYKIRGKKRPSFSKEWLRNLSKAHKGQLPHNTGIKGYTNKGSFKKGHIVSEELREKLSGANCIFYKGGITSLHLAIRSLAESKKWREKIFQRDDYTCQDCNRRRKSGDRVVIHPHHKKEFAVILIEFLKEYDQFSPYEDQHTLLRLATKWKPFWDVDNGITLCKDCHKLRHKGDI